jgi:PDZ domain-containing protein
MIVSAPPTAPVGERPMPRRRWWIPLIVLAAVLSIGVIGAAYVRVPYVGYAPGDASPASARIDVSGLATYPMDGQVFFVTVGTPRLTALGWLVGTLDGDKVDVYTEKEVFGDQTEQENRQENLRLMTYSKDFAEYVALSKLGYPVSVANGGVVIESLCLEAASDGSCARQSPAAAVLQTHDIITAVDATPINVVPDLQTALSGKHAGDTATLTIKRGDQTLEVPVQLTTSDDGRAIVGFIPNPSPPDSITFSFPFDVNIDSGQIGGPSAGLAFSLALLDELTPGELSGGVDVAATGTISPGGAVGPIGGLKQKTIAVMRTKAKLFLVPASEWAEAEAAAKGSDLKVVGVNTLDDALAELGTLGGNATQLGTPGASFQK